MADNFVIARTPEEAAAAKTGENAYLAGGTEALRLGSEYAADEYISIRRTESMRTVRTDSGRVEIGASMTFQELIEHPDVPDYLKEALVFMASRTRRNMATIGGNIAVRRDDSFLIPALIASSAELRLMKADGSTLTASAEDYVFDKDKYSDMLITGISLPTGISLKSVRSSNTAQSHARLTLSMSLSDGVFKAVAAVKASGIYVLDEISAALSGGNDLSEDEIVELVKKDNTVKLSDDLLYGSAAYRRYLMGITLAQMYAEMR